MCTKQEQQLDDVQLARMALEDPKVQEALLRRLYPKIFQIARFTMGSRTLAEDVAQVAALEVMKSLDSFGGVGSIEAWSGRIAYRVAMRTTKKERLREKMLLPISEHRVSAEENLEKKLSREQLFEKLVVKMEKIPRERRIPLLLHLAYGYTVGEVAELTDVSPNTVKYRLKTAYRELRDILEENPSLKEAMLEEIP